MRFLIDLNMDGYATEAEETEACRVFIEEQLDFSASSVKILGVKNVYTEAEYDKAVEDATDPLWQLSI